MKTSDAKFLLRASRPGGRDATDPRFAEAQAQARSDPALREWLAREQAVDAAIAARLDAIAPPAGLRDAILVGARASQPRRAWWRNPLWLAAAACLALAFSLMMFRQPSRVATPAESAFASAALHDVTDNEAGHRGHTPTLASLEARLANPATSLPAALAGLNLADLQAGGCRTLKLAGHEVFELCFTRDGKWYHLYAARGADFLPGALLALAPSLSVEEGHGLWEERPAVASWSDGRNLFALVTTGPDTLRQAL